MGKPQRDGNPRPLTPRRVDIEWFLVDIESRSEIDSRQIGIVGGGSVVGMESGQNMSTKFLAHTHTNTLSEDPRDTPQDF